MLRISQNMLYIVTFLTYILDCYIEHAKHCIFLNLHIERLSLKRPPGISWLPRNTMTSHLEWVSQTEHVETKIKHQIYWTIPADTNQREGPIFEQQQQEKKRQQNDYKQTVLKKKAQIRHAYFSNSGKDIKLDIKVF